MPEWIALSPGAHASAAFKPRHGFSFAAGRMTAAVLLAELKDLLPYYVIAFQKAGDHFLPVVLLGLDNRRNLYLDASNRWLARYVPASLRSYPFALARHGGNMVMCIEKNSLVEGGQEGQPLFTEEGAPAETVRQTLDFLNQCENSRRQTADAVRLLDEAGVIESWPLQLQLEDSGRKHGVEGLYRVSESALNALADDAYARLRGAPMAMAYAQMFSTRQLPRLAELVKYHARQQAASVPEGLEDIFGDDDDDVLSFDFDD